MRIVFLTNSYTYTSAAYIKSLLDKNMEIAGVILLNQLSISRVISKAKKYGLGHVIKRAVEAVKMLLTDITRGKEQVSGKPKSIEALIKENSLVCYKVNDINAERTQNLIKLLNPDIIFVCTLSQILKKDIIEIPKLGCINIHAGLLPKYRGPASNFWVLYNSEEKTGITFYYLNTSIDNGDIILQRELNILPGDTEETLDIRLSELGAKSIAGFISDIAQGKAQRIPQDELEATYFSQPSFKQRKELLKKRKK
ncbi:MAG: formyltransferase family protein [Candidatus Omnitrophota bacterium]